MRYFQVPFNINEEDKIIGGYLSLRQFAWLLLATLVVILLFTLNISYIHVSTDATGNSQLSFDYISLTIRLILGIAIVVLSTLCAFYKVEDTYNFDNYCIKMLKLKFKNNIFKYEK